MKKKVSVVITDLDNTLFDWFAYWFNAYRVFIDEVVRISGLPEECILKEMKGVNQRHRTSEYSQILQEIPSLVEKYPKDRLTEIFASAIEGFRSARESHLRLYPGVRDTLRTLKERGCIVVGYTESQSFYSSQRIRKLDLDGLLDVVYFSEDSLPEDMNLEQVRKHPNDYYRLKETEIRLTPKGAVKPNPDLLMEIIRSLGAQPAQCIYVGDKLTRDVLMAQQAGVTDVWAKYGEVKDLPGYSLLVSVSHWPDEMVQEERRLGEKDIRPDCTLDASFSELLAKFDFVPFRSGSVSDPDMLKLKVEAWKQTIATQQHFNDLEMRIRNFAITITGALLSFAAFALKEGYSVELGSFRIPGPSVLMFIATGLWFAFYLTDRFWYHRLLVGAVKHGLAIEKSLGAVLPELGLTQCIKEHSPVAWPKPIKIWGWGRTFKLPQFKADSERRLVWFYRIIGYALLAISVLFFLMPTRG